MSVGLATLKATRVCHWLVFRLTRAQEWLAKPARFPVAFFSRRVRKSVGDCTPENSIVNTRMKQSTLLKTMALGALCAFLVPAGRFPIQANAQAAAESAGAILPLVQFENAPLVDVIKTLARQANLNVIIDPRVTAVDQTGKSVYPPVSIRLQEQGKVAIKYTIATDGSVTECAVVTGSGKPRLDDAACTMVKKRWKFKPATQDGRPVAVSLPAEVVFALK